MTVFFAVVACIWMAAFGVQSVRVWWLKIQVEGWRKVAMEYQQRPPVKAQAIPHGPASWSVYAPAVWDDTQRDKSN